MKRKKKRTSPHWAVVATAHTARGLREAAALRRGCGIDLVEVRLDFFSRSESWLGEILGKMEIPLILTARHPGEGGSGKLSGLRRAEMLNAFMSLASMIDIELRSARSMRDVLEEAKRRRIEVIVSVHDFSGTPSIAWLKSKTRTALLTGADVVKIATTVRGPRDLATLLALQASSDKLATMGMGPFGKVSRLVLPRSGSRLAYGYLDRPQVEGQWPAALLAMRLAELTR